MKKQFFMISLILMKEKKQQHLRPVGMEVKGDISNNELNQQ